MSWQKMEITQQFFSMRWWGHSPISSIGVEHKMSWRVDDWLQFSKQLRIYWWKDGITIINTGQYIALDQCCFEILVQLWSDSSKILQAEIAGSNYIIHMSFKRKFSIKLNWIEYFFSKILQWTTIIHKILNFKFRKDWVTARAFMIKRCF